MLELYIIAMLLLAGLCFGSFANAAVWRLKTKKDIVKDRSECVHCHHKLAAADLIPVMSWVALGGKCRYCKKPISWQYPAVELAVAAYFVVSYLVWSTELVSAVDWLQFGLWLVYGVALAILFVYDIRWQLLPDRIVKPLIALGAFDFVLRAYESSWSFETFCVELSLALFAISGIYGLLYLVSKGEWIGFGDVKLGVFMGLVLGWQLAFMTLFLANLIGLLVIIPGMAMKKLSRTSRIPFGPFLIIAFILSGLWGMRLTAWYLTNVDRFVSTLML